MSLLFCRIFKSKRVFGCSRTIMCIYIYLPRSICLTHICIYYDTPTHIYRGSNSEPEPERRSRPEARPVAAVPDRREHAPSPARPESRRTAGVPMGGTAEICLVSMRMWV